uniref:Uncharacterized protein n=1 Tax=Ditylenchus dipsaci TaxID=166011 RepID=A0A915ER59_9BILA
MKIPLNDGGKPADLDLTLNWFLGNGMTLSSRPLLLHKCSLTHPYMWPASTSLIRVVEWPFGINWPEKCAIR